MMACRRRPDAWERSLAQELQHPGSKNWWGFPKIRGTYYNGESNGKENGK